MLRKIFKLLTEELGGHCGTREAWHPYFGRIIRFWSKTTPGDYWEAELKPEGASRPIGITFAGTHGGPEEAEVAFCRSVLGDPDATFELCRAAFTPTFVQWVRTPLPIHWKGAFELDGFEIPLHGDPTNSWRISYFVPAARHYFTAYFKKERVHRVVVDG